jgi:hypothetical protein
LVAHGATEGGEAGGLLWSQLEEEGTESGKGERKLVAGNVGVAEERATVLVAFGKDKSFWEMWLLLLLLPRSQWQRRRFLQRRERSGATTTCDGLMAT